MVKLLNINNTEKGVVIENNEIIEVLNKGKYWKSIFSNVEIIEMINPFLSGKDVNKINSLATKETYFEEVFVGENELLIYYENKLFQKIIGPGKYVFWNGLENYTYEIVDTNAIENISMENDVILKYSAFENYIIQYEILSYEKGLVFVNNKFEKIIESGKYYFWKNSQNIMIQKVDMRKIQLEMGGQEILTKDKISIRINFIAQYQISNITKAIIETKEVEKQLYVLLQLKIRTYVGTKTLDELLESKQDFENYVLNSSNVSAESLGVAILEVGIKDIILPGEVKDILNKVLIAEKNAQANIIKRREETASTRSLLNTAKLMEENQMLFKLKEMEYIENIAEKINGIQVNGQDVILDQLKGIFSPKNK